MDELRQISIDEWNKIPKDFIPAHLRQIRKETKEEANEVKEEEIINENKNNEKKSLKLKMVFNKEELTKKARKEIAFIRKKIKAKKKELRKAKKNIIKLKIIEKKRKSLRIFEFKKKFRKTQKYRT